MIFRSAVGAVWLLATVNAFAATATNDPVKAEAEGKQIVAQLLSARPEKNFTNNGTLRVLPRGGGTKSEFSVGFHTFVTPTNWQTYYFTTGAKGEAVGAFAVTYTENRPNEYRIFRGTNANDASIVTGDKAFVPFAGSDFWLADLALEFLHWPDQRVHTKDIKQGKLVWVLTSRNPADGAYSRVVSWINPESGGIFEAEAYDAKGELLKHFEPRSVEKVNGQYQPRELQIRNTKTKSRTRIEFSFDEAQ